MSFRRSGKNPQAYMGVEASQPPQFEVHFRSPTATDYINFNIGTLWLDMSGLKLTPKVLPTNEEIYMLVSKDSKVATWVHMGAGASTFTKLTGDSGGIVGPDAINNNIDIVSGTANISIDGNPGINTLVVNWTGGSLSKTLTGDAGGAVLPDGSGNIDLLGVHGINTLGTPASNRVTAALDNEITLGDLVALGAGVDALTCTTGDITITSGNLFIAKADAAASQGVIYLGGESFIHNLGIHNTFIGTIAGNFAMDTALCAQNTGVGRESLASLTTGVNNSSVGLTALKSVTSGDSNSAIGICANNITTGSFNSAIGNSLQHLVGGNYNVGVGYEAGVSYTGVESSNICLQNPGVIGESHVMRLGEHGTDPSKVDKCFIAGIRGITTTNADAIPVLIDSAHQLGTVSSSRRYKDNIKDMGDESSIVMKLRPVTFNFKSHPDVPAWGLIAEEVAEVFPQLTVYNDDGSAETVKYHEIPVLLLNEIQKLSKRVEELESKLK